MTLWWVAAAVLVGACGDRTESARRAETPETPRAEVDRCYRAGDGILSRLAPLARRGPSWIRVRTSAGDGGLGRLTDSSGAVLELAWARAPGDSLDVRGADDFIQFSARLAATDSGLTGPARLFSDAQLERTPDGRTIPAERAWMLSAVPADCDSVPPPWTGAP